MSSVPGAAANTPSAARDLAFVGPFSPPPRPAMHRRQQKRRTPGARTPARRAAADHLPLQARRFRGRHRSWIRRSIRPGLTPSFGGEAAAEEVQGAGRGQPHRRRPLRAPVHPDFGQYRQGAGAVRHRQRLARRRARAAQGPPAAGPARRAHGGGRLQAGRRRRRRHHARPSRPYRRADRRRPSRSSPMRATCSARPNSISGRSGENVREARKFNRELYVQDLRAARRPRDLHQAGRRRSCPASPRSMPSAIRRA